MHAVAGAVRHGLGHERADHAHAVGDFPRAHPQQHKAVGGCQGVAELVVDLELAVGVLVVDLVDLKAHLLEAGHQLLQEGTGTGKPLVVVTGLIQVVGVVHQLQLPRVIPREKRELWLQPGIEGPSPFAQAFQLPLQHVAGIVGVGLIIDVARARQASVAGLPRDRRECIEIPPGHEIRSMGFDPQAPDREPGKTGAVLDHVHEAVRRHGLGLGHAMDVHELRQHVTDVVLRQQCFSFCWQHCPTPST